MKDLKERTIRGGSARGAALAATFLLRIASLMVLARLLDPKDFGLLGMVTAFTGVLSLFRDFGLSAAAVQRSTVSEEQSSTLFWVNILVGALLTLIAVALAPAVATFYREPRLALVTSIVAVGFLINAAGVQHSALLQREMRFTSLAWIDVASLAISTVAAVISAKLGMGYWALVVMSVCVPLSTTTFLWLASGWVPGRLHQNVGLRSMMRFGGFLTLNGLVMYVASNFDKILLGRFWGAESLGIYGRAYQLIRIPTDNLNSAVGDVAFSGLSRIQDDPVRVKRYFLKGYSLVVALTLPITAACALFADDIVLVLLGPKWNAAVGIFRLLAPTMMIFAITNPLGWLLNSIGLVGRGLKIALVIAPLMIASYFIGLPYGPTGVALAYSAVMMVWALPVIAWAVHGTMISFGDVLRAVARPLASIIPAALLSLGVRLFLGHTLLALPRLMIESAVIFAPYFLVLLYVAGQKAFFLDLLQSFRRSPEAKEKPLNAT